jgi:hypothetical protein
MLWEASTGVFPFTARENDLVTRVSERLRFQARVHSVGGNYNLDPLLSLSPPGRMRMDLGAEQETIFLKAIGLELNAADELDVGTGFGSAAEFATALRTLRDTGFTVHS